MYCENTRSFTCCDSRCYVECWLKQDCVGDIVCLNIKTFLRKDRRTLEKAKPKSIISQSDVIELPKEVKCIACDEDIDLRSQEPRHRKHLLQGCSIIKTIQKGTKRKWCDEQLIEKCVHIGFLVDPTTWVVRKRRKTYDPGGFRGISAEAAEEEP